MSGGGTQSTTQTSGPPQQFLQAYQNVVNQANNVASQPLQQYAGPLVNGFTPDQEAGFQQVENATGVANPYINAASGYFNAATQPLWNSSLPQYGGTDPTSGLASTGINTVGGGISGIQSAVGGIAPAVTGANTAVNNATGGINTAIGQANTAVGMGSPVNYGANVGTYMSPYTNDVVNATEAQFNNQNAQQNQGLVSNAIASGAWGGDRAAVAQGILGGQQQLAEAPVIANLENQGYQNAQSELNTQQGIGLQGAQLGLSGSGTAGNLGIAGAQTGLQGANTGIAGNSAIVNAANPYLSLFTNQQQTQLSADQANAWLNSQAAFGMGNLGTEAQNSALTGANALLGIGGEEQQLGQEQLNIPYEEFEQQQAYPFQTTNWLSGIVEGIGSNAGGTSTTTSPAPSTGSQVLGGLAGAGGLLGATGAFGDSGWLTGSTPTATNFGSVGGYLSSQPITDVSGGYNFQPIKTGGRVHGGGAGNYSPGGSIGGAGIVPRFAGGGSMVSSAVPDVSVSFVPQPTPGGGGIAQSWMHQPNVSATSAGGGDNILGDLSSAAGIVKTGISLASLFNRGGIVRRASGGTGGAVTPTLNEGPMISGNLTGINGIQIPQLSAPSPVGQASGTASYLNPLEQYQPPGTTPITKTTNNLPATPDWATSTAKATPEDVTTAFQTLLGRDPGQEGISSYQGKPLNQVYQAITGQLSGDAAAGTEYQNLLAAGKVPGETQSTTTTGYEFPHTTYTPNLGSTPSPASTGSVITLPGGQTINLANLGNLPMSRGGGIRHYDDGGDIQADGSPTAPATGGIAPPTYQPFTPNDNPQRARDMAPWLALAAAGFGAMGGRSPFAGVNIGQGALEGLKTYAGLREEADKEQQTQAQMADTGQYRKADLDQRAQDLSQRAQESQARIKQAGDQLAAQVEHNHAEEAISRGELGLRAEALDQGRWSYLGPSTDPKNPGSIFFDSKTNTTKIMPVQVGPKDMPNWNTAGAPTTEATESPLTGDAALKAIPSAAQPIVKGMVNGTIQPPSSFAMARPYWQQMLEWAAQVDPTFDQTTWSGRVAARRDLATGQSGKTITALNTALQHAQVLDKAFGALDNGDIPTLNAASNWISKQLGSAAPTNAQEAVNALASEARKVFAASGSGNLTELENWEHSFPINGSPAQQKGALRELIGLMDSRLEAVANQYNRAMGRTDDPTSLLSPEARSAYYDLTGENPPHSAQVGPGTYATAKAPQLLPMPATKDGLIPGKAYNTGRGPATWDGKQFVPIGAGGP